MTEPQLLDYRPASLAPRRPIFSVTPCIVVAIPILFVYALAIFIVPKFDTIFKDFGTKLPQLTMCMLDISRHLANTGLAWLLPIVVPALAGFVAPRMIEPSAQNRRQRQIIALLLVLAALLVMLIVFVIGMTLPALTLIQGISGKTGK